MGHQGEMVVGTMNAYHHTLRWTRNVKALCKLSGIKAGVLSAGLGHELFQLPADCLFRRGQGNVGEQFLHRRWRIDFHFSLEFLRGCGVDMQVFAGMAASKASEKVKNGVDIVLAVEKFDLFADGLVIFLQAVVGSSIFLDMTIEGGVGIEKHVAEAAFSGKSPNIPGGKELLPVKRYGAEKIVSEIVGKAAQFQKFIEQGIAQEGMETVEINGYGLLELSGEIFNVLQVGFGVFLDDLAEAEIPVGNLFFDFETEQVVDAIHCISLH